MMIYAICKVALFRLDLIPDVPQDSKGLFGDVTYIGQTGDKRLEIDLVPRYAGRYDCDASTSLHLACNCNVCAQKPSAG